MKNLWILLLACYPVSFAWAQEHHVMTLSESLDSLALHQKWVAEIPGFAIGVIVDHDLVFQNVYGVQRLESD